MKPTHNPGVILLVDDDDSIRRLVKKILEAAGYSVIAATDGDLGLETFRQHQKAIALLLTDVAMPKMNGLDLADSVLELDPALPVIFMSATECADRGYGYVAKPFRAAELLGRIGAVL